MSRSDFERSLVTAARDMSAELTAQSTLERAALMCVEALDSCDLAGICVFDDAGANTCAATHANVMLIDELQHDLGEGPALNELRDSDVFTVSDLLDDPPWPKWGPKVADDIGVRSFMGFRLFVTDGSLGVLNLYSFEPDAFEYQDVMDGMVLAGHAAVALSAALRQEQMHTALQTRQMIGEATGILRQRFSLTTEQAYATMTRVSSQQNMNLFAVAQHVVDTGALP